MTTILDTTVARFLWVEAVATARLLLTILAEETNRPEKKHMPFIVVVFIVCFVAWPLIPFLVVTAWPLICLAAFFVVAVIATLTVFVIVDEGSKAIGRLLRYFR